MAYTLPHGPHVVPDYGSYASKSWTAEEKAYAAMVTRMDDGIGQIITRLHDLGLDHDTIVFFCSDNGPTTEVTLFDSNGPLRAARPSSTRRHPHTDDRSLAEYHPAGMVNQEAWPSGT